MSSPRQIPLPPDHFLSQPRPDPLSSARQSSSSITVVRHPGAVDTSTLAAHDFDVDTRTGFMPPQPPLARLPPLWEPWEELLEDAVQKKLKHTETLDLTESDKEMARTWRKEVQDVRGPSHYLFQIIVESLLSQLLVLPTIPLKKSEVSLRRAHLVLTWLMHFYINTLPDDAAIIIPRSISIPLLYVSHHLALPPLLTYSDNVLYNWAFIDEETSVSRRSPSPLSSSPPSPWDFGFVSQRMPTLTNIKCQTLFTSSKDEEVFYLTSARIELCGVEALSVMRASMDEAFVGDSLSLLRISTFLSRLASVIDDMAHLLLAVREGCDPEFFYRHIRPWFKGQDSMNGERKWIFEGLEECIDLDAPTELSGPSAGQSSIIHAIDIFLGVDHTPPSARVEDLEVELPSNDDGRTEQNENEIAPITPSPPSHFLQRMQAYMPRHHRAFLNHLRSNPRPLRAMVQQSARRVASNTGNTPESGTSTSTSPSSSPNSSPKLGNPRKVALDPHKSIVESYNTAVRALKHLRDAHLRIVALYIIGPARKLEAERRERMIVKSAEVVGEESVVKGTGGTDAMPFLKTIRDRTKEAEIQIPNSS